MKVVVAVKQVAVLGDGFELQEDARGVDPGFLDWELNEWDRVSVEAAVQARDTAGAGEVLVITVGDVRADEALLDCLAQGADRALRVWDGALHDAEVLAIAGVLAAAVGREQADFVLCGAQSADAVNGATGVALAALLGLPHVAVVTGLEIKAGCATVERELEDGLVEVLSVRLPALLTIQTGCNEPRTASLRAIKQATAKPLEVIGLDQLGLDADAEAAAVAPRVRRLAPPLRPAATEMLAGPPSDVAARIAEIIHERVGT